MKDTYFFSHDANALTDTKILNMRADYGLEGYGLFWAIIEQLRCEENYSLPRNKNTYRALKINTNTSIDVEKYINDCINEYGLFKVSEDGESFYSCSLKRRMAIKDEKKLRRSEAGKKGAEKRWKNNDDTTDTPQENGNAMANALQNDGNAITKPSEKMANNGKGKESKGKEKKVKKIININKTKLNETFDFIINNNTKEIAEKNKLTEPEVQGFFNILKRLDLIPSKEWIGIMMPNEVMRYKLSTYAIFEIYKSSYKVFLKNLGSMILINKYEKTREYIGNADENDNKKLNEFMSYFIRCIQDELENSE